MKTLGLFLLGLPLMGLPADFRITELKGDGRLTWTNAQVPGVVNVQTAPHIDGPWQPALNQFATTSVGQAQLELPAGNQFVRLLSADISGTPAGHTNLTRSYGLLETIGGKGEFSGNHVNYWREEYEGGRATNANLSRPHIAFADAHNNLLVVDEGSDSVLKITPEGTIQTFAGTHVRGFNGNGPAPATTLNLDRPNGGWLSPNGTFYVMDTYNSRVCRIDTNGMMVTLFAQPDPNQFDREGRGLWVNNQETLAFFCAGTVLSKWTPTGGVEVVRSDFLDLANILGSETTGDLYITDRDAHSVYVLSADGALTTIAGNGTTRGGGDGFPALDTGLNRPRTIAFLPNGGYLLGEHDPGNRVWYVDPAGIIHLWINGSGNGASVRRVGDGDWFYQTPSLAKVSKVRSITLDQFFNVILVENDFGLVRRINFLRQNE